MNKVKPSTGKYISEAGLEEITGKHWNTSGSSAPAIPEKKVLILSMAAKLALVLQLDFT